MDVPGNGPGGGGKVGGVGVRVQSSAGPGRRGQKATQTAAPTGFFRLG
jgi:hypothetical protein